jgi:hypothetical protein
MRLLPQDGQSRITLGEPGSGCYVAWRTCTPNPRQGVGTSLAEASIGFSGPAKRPRPQT